jgi:hypothetical protein
VTTSMITPPLSICANPAFVVQVDFSMFEHPSQRIETCVS